MSTPAPKSMDIIDPDGDVLLIVPAPQETDERPAPSRFLVSSKYLILGCDFFEARFGPNGQDGRDLEEYGSVKIHLETTAHSPETMHILLSIIHGFQPWIPAGFDTIGLWKLALATHYFLCYEALQSWGLWYCQQLVPTLPTEFPPSSWKLIFISYVFGHHTLFRHLTKMAQQRATGSIYAGPSPIPKWILQEILGKRDKYLKRCFDLVYERIAHLASPYIHCTRACDTKKAAALMQYVMQFQHPGPLMICETETVTSSSGCSPFLFFEAAKRWVNPEHESHASPLPLVHAADPLNDTRSDVDSPPRVPRHFSWNNTVQSVHPLVVPPCTHKDLLGEELSRHLMQMEDQLQGITGILDNYPGRQ
ncbi:uncharacterized protein N7496_012490 [Penicillium cataractarum]|uniref:BTB domain-containing protein n=1 Tax=Penicillium cataractarum TaxID=2100454 RepID=A0A9W9R842_9EURO|nr:uncharacterized protein N7496_012490 [Penicillium cataractarum]KAJ5355278.1 hypothetical protein N7496_012490 [Penicillium cataractarum]